MAKSTKGTINIGAPGPPGSGDSAAGIGGLIPAASSTARLPDPYGFGQDLAHRDVRGVSIITAAGGSGSAVAEREAHLSTTATMDAFLHASPQVWANIQALLFQGGFYGQDYVPVPGVLHPQDRDALKKALLVAAQSGQALDQYLEETAAATASSGANASPVYEPVTHVIRHTNPIDVRAAALSGAQAAIGRKLTDTELARFAEHWSATETAAQTAGFAQDDAARRAYIAAQQGTGPADLPVSTTTNVTDPASVQNAAEDFARRTAPAEASGHDLYGYFAKALDFFSRPGGIAPSTGAG